MREMSHRVGRELPQPVRDTPHFGNHTMTAVSYPWACVLLLLRQGTLDHIKS